jgi:hypothetical protein
VAPSENRDYVDDEKKAVRAKLTAMDRIRQDGKTYG